MFNKFLYGRFFNVVRTSELKLFSSLFQELAPTTSAPNLDKERLPFWMKSSKFGSLGVDVTSEEIEALKRLPPTADVKTLYFMRDHRLYDYARVFLKLRLTNGGALNPISFLKMCELVKDCYLYDNIKPEDRTIIKLLRNQLPNLPFLYAKTAKIYLDCCEDAYDMSERNADLFQQKEVTEAILGFLLKQKRYDEFSQLLKEQNDLQILRSGPLLYLISRCAKTAPSISESFLNRLILEKCLPSVSYLDPIQRILENSKMWDTSFSVISHDRRCRDCGGVIMEEERVEGEDFIKLRQAFKEYVFKTSVKSACVKLETVKKLLSYISRLPQAAGPSLVVDGLNLACGKFYESLLYKKLLCALEDFKPIVLISRAGESEELLQKIRKLDIFVFQCEKRADDDLCTLLSALMLGPKCYIMSNDYYRYYVEQLSHESHLFKKWLRSRSVRHQQYGCQYFMPDGHAMVCQRVKDVFHIPYLEKSGDSYLPGEKISWLCCRKRT